jgi:hypothetical protein
MNSNKNIVVLGCPRSGTSLVANLIRSAGYDIDDNHTKPLMKPNINYNPDGYFERIDIVKLNDRLIKEINNESNFLNCPSLEEIQKYTGSNNTNLIEICRELSSYDNWIIKDSRLSFTLHLYKNINYIHIVKVVRKPEEVELSMQNHYGPLFNSDVVHGPHSVKRINFKKYYSTINNCIDWQRQFFPSIEINYQDILHGNVQVLNNFINSNIDKSIINEKYYRQKV